MTLDDVRAYPHQIGDALWRIDAAGIPQRSLAGGVAVCGVAYGAGELAAEILGDRAMASVRDGLGTPPADDTFVLVASYSGDDQEALDCFDEAGRRDAPRAVVCTAGVLAARAREQDVPVIGIPAGIDDPRAAIVYFVLAALVIADPSRREEVEAVVPTLAGIAEMSPDEVRAIDPDELLEGKSPAVRTLAGLMLKDLAGVSG